MSNGTELWMEKNITSSPSLNDVTSMMSNVTGGVGEEEVPMALVVAETLFVVLDPILTFGGLFCNIISFIIMMRPNLRKNPVGKKSQHTIACLYDTTSHQKCH